MLDDHPKGEEGVGGDQSSTNPNLETRQTWQQVVPALSKHNQITSYCTTIDALSRTTAEDQLITEIMFPAA